GSPLPRYALQLEANPSPTWFRRLPAYIFLRPEPYDGRHQSQRENLERESPSSREHMKEAHSYLVLSSLEQEESSPIPGAVRDVPSMPAQPRTGRTGSPKKYEAHFATAAGDGLRGLR